MPSNFVHVNKLSEFTCIFSENKTKKDVSFIFSKTSSVQSRVSEILECFRQPGVIIDNLSLDFTHHSLEKTDINALANFLKSEICPESIEIILTSSNLNIQYLDILSRAIGGGPCRAKSVSLNLACNRLGNECIRVLANNLLSSNSAPEKLALNLAYNRITDDGVGELCEYIRSRTSSIQDLSVNLLFNQVSEIGSSILVQTLRNITEKRKFKINYEFGEHGVKTIIGLADALKLRTSSATALSLDFGVQHLSKEAIDMIFTALTQISVPQQIELNLSDQGLGDDGFIKILDKLDCINADISLRLYLFLNSIRDRGARALAQFIRKNDMTCDLLLDVSQNAFGGDDSKALIISAIREHPEIFAHLRLVGPTQEITTLAENKKDEILTMMNMSRFRP